MIQSERLHSPVHDEFRAVTVNSQVVDFVQQYCKDLGIYIVCICLVIFLFNGMLCPEIISPFGKDKNGAGILFTGFNSFLYKWNRIDTAVGF